LSAGVERVERALLPWARLIGFGLGILRLSPAAFWRMTPRELLLAAEAMVGPSEAPLDRAGLTHLMQRYPDRAEARHGGSVR
jgi:uncharacterized phage protein (TIGR02216 family)